MMIKEISLKLLSKDTTPRNLKFTIQKLIKLTIIFNIITKQKNKNINLKIDFIFEKKVPRTKIYCYYTFI
jgi:hypothetical protein